MMLAVRPSCAEDAVGLCAVLNPIIRAGGSTALETPLDPDTLLDWFIDGPHVLASHVVASGERIFGFQALSDHARLPDGWADIATFTDRIDPVPGAGQALFPATCAIARARGLAVLNATIRADNAGGLRYYRALGFRLYDQSLAVPLADGRPIDRLHHRLDL